MVLFKKLPEKYVLGLYYPGYFCDKEPQNPNFNEYSQMIINLQEEWSIGLNYFEEILNRIIEDEEGTALVVPSTESGTKVLIQRIARRKPNIIDATDIWMNKSKNLNDRGMMLVKDNNVIVIDDVVRTGNTMRSCKNALLGAKAKEVKCIALGKVIPGFEGKEEAYDTIINYSPLKKMRRLREIEFAKKIYDIFVESTRKCQSNSYNCISHSLDKIEEEKQQFEGNCEGDYYGSLMDYEEVVRVIEGDDTFSYNNEYQYCFHW